MRRVATAYATAEAANSSLDVDVIFGARDDPAVPSGQVVLPLGTDNQPVGAPVPLPADHDGSVSPATGGGFVNSMLAPALPFNSLSVFPPLCCCVLCFNRV